MRTIPYKRRIFNGPDSGGGHSPARFCAYSRDPRRPRINSAGKRKEETDLMRTKIVRNIFISVGVLFALTRSVAAATFITFDVPGAFGTIPGTINPMGTITGDYLGADFTFHGFERAPNGTITTFDAPGAVNGTFPSAGITPNGTIAGSYADADCI